MADLAVTAASVLKASDAVVKYGVCGAAITQGKPVYLDANGLWQLADANLSAAAAGSAGNVGIALNTTTAVNQDITVLVGGSWNPGATVAVGTVYVISATNTAAIAPAADLASGWYTTILGVATTAAKITMPPGGPFVSGVAVP